MSQSPWLDKKREWSGYWWFPGAPDDRLPGVLSYTPEEGLVLLLVGGFAQTAIQSVSLDHADVVDLERDWSRLHGIAANRPLTLLSCYPTRTFSYMFGEPDTQLVDVEAVLDGIHLEDATQSAFDGANMSIENLTYWGEHSGIEAALKVEDSRYQGSKITATPQDAWVVSTDLHTFKIRHQQTSPTFTYERARVVARVIGSAVLEISSTTPATAEGLRNLCQSLADLISLATHSASALLWTTLVPTPAMIDDGSRSEISYYFRQSGPQPNGDASVGVRTRLFGSGDIPFEVVLPRWLETERRLRPAINQILGLRKVEGLYIETQLLQAVSAAEALHGALGYEPPIPPDEFAELKQMAVNAVPAPRQLWLKTLLIRNDPSLKQKLLDLVQRPDSQAMSVLVPDPSQWASMTVKARNELAHGGQSIKYPVGDLHAIARVTTAVVLMNLLNEIGLTPEAPRSILTANADFASAARLASSRCVKGD